MLKILCPNPFPKNAQIVKLINADLDLSRRIHLACGFHGFMILFWIWPEKRTLMSNVQILKTLHVHHAFWYISLHPLHTYKKNAMFPILVPRARRSLKIQPNGSGDENAYFKSIELAYLENNVRALVLLPFIGNINKLQYFKIYS